jgi:outer membrane protein assembly factor BamD (BamD/ComL family)
LVLPALRTVEQLSDQTGPLKIFYGIAAAVMLTASPVFSQTLSDAVRHIQQGEMDSAYAELERLPVDSAVEGRFFIDGLMQSDADSACQIYEQLVECYPRGRYTDEALVRLAQRDFIVGSFREGISRLMRLLRDFPASPNCPKAHYWIGISYSNLGIPDSALARFQTVIKDFPTSDVSALSQIEIKALQFRKTREKTRYFVQVGAFGEKTNATAVQKRLIQDGYESTIQLKTVDDRQLYVVLTGKTDLKVNAIELADLLKKRYQWNTRIVENP